MDYCLNSNSDGTHSLQRNGILCIQMGLLTVRSIYNAKIMRVVCCAVLNISSVGVRILVVKIRKVFLECCHNNSVPLVEYK